MPRLVIVGGSDAGISAALRAREVDPRAEVQVLVADRFPNFSICGLPYYLSGEVPDWRLLAHRTTAEIEGQGINLLLNLTAQRIEPVSKNVIAVDPDGTPQAFAYDRLVIATGATPIRPRIAGLDLPGVYVLHSMADSFALHDHLTTNAPRSALIIGGGYIGLEMADALTRRGLTVTLVEQAPEVLPTVDSSLGDGVAAALRRHGVMVATGSAVEAILPERTGLLVTGSAGFRVLVDLVLVAVGVRPETTLAREAGIAMGERGAIRVSRAMATNLVDILAAGDCVETWHRFLDRPAYLPLGTTAHKQGRVAGENAVGGQRLFEGSLGTQVVKVFDLACASTGLREEAAREFGYDPLTVESVVPDHKPYYPGARNLRIRVAGDRRTGQLLGAQMLGHWQAEVAKRIDIFATALFHRMQVDALNDLDLSYTPPLSSPWDPVQVSAQAWVLAQRLPRPDAAIRMVDDT
ncbi:MAG TPA: FAD-dependent oxidoreductase [Chloroflexota bacterium]|nr:FAD-dependent oxidoreductase [Chloroflexota bacterium]